MKQQIVYNLEEYATKYQLKDIFGAYAAHFSVSGANSDSTFNSVAIENADDLFHSMVTERALFAKFLLVKQGSCTIKLQIKGDEETVTLSPKTLLTVTAKEVGEIIDVSDDFDAEVILVDEPTSDNACRSLVICVFSFVRAFNIFIHSDFFIAKRNESNHLRGKESSRFRVSLLREVFYIHTFNKLLFQCKLL